LREASEILRLLSAGLVPCFAYLCVGLRVARRFGPAAVGAERWAWAWLFGTGVCSLAILLLRSLDVPLPLLAAGAVAAALWPFRDWAGQQRGAPAAPGGWWRPLELVAAAFGALLFAAALGPETFWDGFEYHLPLVAAWTEGPIRALPGFIDAEFRAGIDLLYVPAVTSGYPDAAASVSAAFALALAALVRAEASRRASAGAGALAGAFVLVAPLTIELAPSSYVDLGVGAYGFAGLALVDRWNRGGSERNLTAAALCLAFAANAKLHAAALVPAALALAWLGGRRPAWALQARCAALLVGVAAPWFLKTALTSGNPFFPLLGGWLGTGAAEPRYFELRAFRGAANYPVARDPAGFLQYLVSLTFGRNVHVSGLLGPLPLALAPLAVAKLSRATWALLGVCAALLVPLFVTLPAARFGTPLWPWVAVAAAVGGHRLAASGGFARRVLAAVLLLVAAQQTLLATRVLVPRVLALRAPRAYERERFPEQDALRRMVAQAEPVVGIPMGAVSWMTQPVYNLLWERNGELYFMKGTSPEVARARLVERDVRSLVIDAEAELLARGRTGHAIVDAWLDGGVAALAPEIEPLPARAGRQWVLVRFVTRRGETVPP